MNQPIFIASVFIKTLAWTLIIAVVGLVGVLLIFGHITTLDMFGTLISAVIIAYIVHLWIYYSRGSPEDE
ncbi:MAG: hypothetical protein B6D58_09880 [candidate division Zixibacteria bacterium 4484_95]|nr:MAG: hypothetical protein B6D58_09880 [candidate division Zixibacteria bacterium 4484_95]RKX19754.1 MAG: hypothetical protein DRP26_02905 [candidate division Zixibacteria bacterium]